MTNEKLQATSTLTAKQAADVIRYYHAGENQRSRECGWKDKISLARSAIRASSPEHSILPDGEPTLTQKERISGLAHIENPPKSDAYYERWEEIANKQNLSYDEAKKILDNQ